MSVPANKSLASWIWGAACSVRGVKDAPEYQGYIVLVAPADPGMEIYDPTFDGVIANPMRNQDWFTEADHDNDELDRFPAGAGFPGESSADWGWPPHMHASLNTEGCAAIVLDTDFPNEYSRTEVGTSFLSGNAFPPADGKFNINFGTLKRMLVPVPAIDEQREIVRALALADDKASNVVSKMSMLQDLLRTFLPSLMN